MRMVLKNRRLEIKAFAEEQREDAKNFGKAVIALEKQLVGMIEAEEKRLENIQDEWTQRASASAKRRSSPSRSVSRTFRGGSATFENTL